MSRLEFMDTVEASVGARIKVVGVGSGGVNAVNTMIARGISGVEYVAVNTDLQHLNQSSADVKLALTGSTRGQGTGGDPVKGRDAALQQRQEIVDAIKGAHMLVIPTGLGGGTGTGASPVIAEIAREMDILTVAVATMPFQWDGYVKRMRAYNGLRELKEKVDAFVTIPNDKMMKMSPGRPSREALQAFDGILCDAVAGVVELVTRPGYINRDFQDVRAVLHRCGQCVIATGVGEGGDRAYNAVMAALNNPLLEDTPVEEAQNILVNIVQGPSGTMDEVGVVMNLVNERLTMNGNISGGMADDDSLGEKIKVTIIASGMPEIDEVPPQLPRFKNEESPLTRSGSAFLETAPVQSTSVRTRSFPAIDAIGIGSRTTQEEVNSEGRMMLGSVGGSEFERPSVTRVDSGLKAFGYYPGNGNKTDLR
ncbi:MAG TPA: cell division protein FtsZ [Myxococcota bacterium]|nr:cell division protein FtsZ [Myxococcota bacterium]HNZ02947.1 cell division protein FtsZ [Myxococcota bacterium]HOD07171.1 cell division protein FtsZ [Myxococcota bacterium]HPB49995.1 cell division protein FtsZ [Myxococcota bacterium]HQP95003.1 cell division protein FtsZ [Myxococcota bacterium]